MKLLADHSIEHAPAGRVYGPQYSTPLLLECAFLAVRRAHEHAYPVERELVELKDAGNRR